MLPNFRGKVRVLKILYRLFVKEGKHDIIFTKLHRPVSYKAMIDTHCAHELMAYMMSGYEYDTVKFLDRIYDKNSFFFDIGANIGLISIPFTIMQKNKFSNHKKYTYCFEAITSNCNSLNYNIKINNLKNNISAFCIGLGDTEKNAEIQVEGNLKRGEGTGTASIISAHSNYKCERIKLYVTTLDKLIDAGKIPSSCSLIKLDTDGYDFFILKGAKHLLSNSRPIIYGEFMEYCLNWHNQSIKNVISYVEDFNYLAYAKKQNKWLFSDKIKLDSFICDLLLVPEEKLDMCKWCIY